MQFKGTVKNSLWNQTHYTKVMLCGTTSGIFLDQRGLSLSFCQCLCHKVVMVYMNRHIQFISKRNKSMWPLTIQHCTWYPQMPTICDLGDGSGILELPDSDSGLRNSGPEFQSKTCQNACVTVEPWLKTTLIQRPPYYKDHFQRSPFKFSYILHYKTTLI